MINKLVTFFFILILIVAFISCSLDRNNPLDPIDHPGVYSPPQVDSLWIDVDSLKWIKPVTALSDTTIYADGYFVWGAKQWDTKFDLLEIKFNADETSSYVNEFHIEEGYLVFKVSSYKIYSSEADTLEGYSSKAVTFP